MSEIIHRTDTELVNAMIAEAERDHRPIAHPAARAIAALLHEGQTTAMYSLASCGAISDDLSAELGRDLTNPDEEIRRWARALCAYADHHGTRSAVEGWHAVWPLQSTSTMQ